MTVQDILNAALALMFESVSTAPDYVEKTPAILNVLVPEVFEINNDLRAFKKLEPLKDWPMYKSLTDDIIFEPELCRAALPYGLATNLLLGDEEDARAVNFNAKYADAVNACMILQTAPIIDVYGGYNI